MEIKFKQLLFTVQKRTLRCNLKIANFWIEDYMRFSYCSFCFVLLENF